MPIRPTIASAMSDPVFSAFYRVEHGSEVLR